MNKQLKKPQRPLFLAGASFSNKDSKGYYYDMWWLADNGKTWGENNKLEIEQYQKEINKQKKQKDI